MDDCLALPAVRDGAEGGVSVMTVISFVGITLAVFCADCHAGRGRSGFRTEFVGTILWGQCACHGLFRREMSMKRAAPSRVIEDYDDMADRLAAVEGVTRVAGPLIKGQVMASANSRNTGVEVFGIKAPKTCPPSRALPDGGGGGGPETAMGDIGQFKDGGCHRLWRGAPKLNLGVGDTDPPRFPRTGCRTSLWHIPAYLGPMSCGS